MEIRIEKGRLQLTRQGEALLKAMQVEIEQIKSELHEPCPQCQAEWLTEQDRCPVCTFKPFDLKGEDY